jgi:hypothetical protein
MGCFVRGKKWGNSGGGGCKNGVEDEFVLANLVRVRSFGGSRIRCINGRALFDTSDKVKEIIANEQCFKLSPPLRKGGRGEFFVDGGCSIDGEDR